MSDINLPKMISFIFLSRLFAKVVTINVAFNKSGMYCGKKSALQKLFDGDLTNVLRMTERCLEKSYIDVNLGASVMVNYVVVFGGKENDQGQLDFFRVYKINGSNTSLCSQYPGFADIDKGMRVNCKPSKEFSSGVRIESLKNEGLAIAEIEVHTLARKYAIGQGMVLYRGCFFAQSSYTQNFKSCLSQCLDWNHAFAGTKDNAYCVCKNVLNGNEILPTKCNYKCQDNESYCGNSEGFSFYIVKFPLPYYVGCLRIPADLKMKKSAYGLMTVEVCLNHCQTQFALLKAGSSCICEEKVDENDAVDTSNCNARCSGDHDSMCGSNEHISVFKTCKQDTYSHMDCQQVFHCEGGFDKYGVCKVECKPGYFGEHCIERDIDECQFKPCDVKTSTCRNLYGSYSCDCNYGYEKGDDVNSCVAVNLTISFVMSVLLSIFVMILTIILATVYGPKAMEMGKKSMLMVTKSIQRISK